MQAHLELVRGVAGLGARAPVVVDERGKLARLAADTIQASIAGSGDIHAHARTRAAISILGSGDVDVVGGARCTITKTGSGTATCH